ncbi:hypothetical protein HA052_20515 [Chromobacterium haemolyticum]|uniref:Uncharacterized protein n=1 Tax=Chromobacterium fluminis TaxID=3044269 RepID=A0ABX0L9H1_9NEIS|nr:hypothetical protein [Chromobacterium haemolyticum]NHR07576.1 hypothetical protein [Chromobacterium haemolyticum]
MNKPVKSAQDVLKAASQNIEQWPSWKQDLARKTQDSTTSSVSRFAPSAAYSCQKREK